MLLNNQIPILEYDTTSAEIIAPNHGKEAFLPEKCVFAFLGDVVENYAKEHEGRIVEAYETVSKTFPIYVVKYEDEDICMVQVPVGAPAATAMLDNLIALGCKKIIATGSCGVLEELEENAFVIPVKALRAEGTSYHYLEASRFIDLDADMIDSIAKTLEEMHLPYQKCTTWTTDGFFRETQDMVQHRVAEGCAVVEMECAALAACAKKRGAKFGQFLFTADSLANVENYDARNFGKDSHGKALELAFYMTKHM